ncbi:CDP-alcohol phosphatidyltransferase family protein [Arenicella xantha]|uniref:CDP-diacylglycerol--glycerol-3-phosphate 3-phosphatidyltransferase n=1 Tax=Arenicella xantha TaxID=644221 RepID=A0A395JLG4_9GAMM|nr:CDP-alcohol phosphatidyltransferase family protein [Arenicella xantha]RBP51551.1 cardiolipin synthase [Arenicella xantha]
MIYIPNLLTLARIGLVPWLVVLLQETQYGWSLAVFIIAGVSDALDGFIAKRFNAATHLGAILDPLADKALLVSAYVMLSVMEVIPFWLMVVVVFRDIIIVGGYLVMVLFFGSVKMQPLKISKLNTFTQITYIVIILSTLAWQIQIADWLPWFNYAVLATSVISGIAYVYIWSLKATHDLEVASESTLNESS